MIFLGEICSLVQVQVHAARASFHPARVNGAVSCWNFQNETRPAPIFTRGGVERLREILSRTQHGPRPDPHGPRDFDCFMT